jgi:REP element-mobilizing transposase RayT
LIHIALPAQPKLHATSVAPIRTIDPEGTYHVMSRGNYRRVIFPDGDHVERWLALLARVTARRDWVVADWCVMPNHFHLLIRLTDGGLSEGMRELNGCYSRWSNGVHELTGTGHLVRNRFKSRPVTDDPYFFQLLRYFARNPVAAGLTQALESWPWAGYKAMAGLEHPRPFHRPAEALQLFSSDPSEAQRSYHRHVLTGLIPEGLDPWSDDDLGSVA